jgi:CubicO group peptidase (beta-lactamase class C family)
MTPRDLARIGVAVLGDGLWGERQVIPAGWLSASFTGAVPIPDGRHYGYHWYLGSVPMSDSAGVLRQEGVISASGNGGQRLFLLPRLDLVVVITAGNYDAPGDRRWSCCAMCCCQHFERNDRHNAGCRPATRTLVAE